MTPAIYRFTPYLGVVTGALIVAILLVASAVNARIAADLTGGYRELRQAVTDANLAVRLQLDEETGVRGYALTGNRSLLSPYESARDDLQSKLAQLEATLQDLREPALAARARHLVDLNRTWERDVATPTIAAKDPRQTAGLQLRGKQLVDAFRADAGDIADSLAARSDALFADSFAHLEDVGRITFVLILLSVASIAGFTIYERRTRADRTRSAETVGRLETLVRAIPQMVWIADAKGDPVFFNDRWYAFAGTGSLNSFGARPPGLMHPDDAEGVRAAWARAVKAGEPFEFERRLRAVDGTYRWFVTRAAPERDASGSIVAWFGTCTDVDAQRRASEAEIRALQDIVDAFHQAQFPVLPATSTLQFAATYTPARDAAQFGGDWYDAFTFDGRRYYFSLGDVTGHGLDAAIVTIRVRQAIYALCSVESDPSRVLERANSILASRSSDIVTAVCGAIDDATGDIVYASAGHPPGLIVSRGGSIRTITSGAPPLGTSTALKVSLQTERLAAGEMLVLYTDGIVEHRRNVIAGERALHEAAAQAALAREDNPARAIGNRILGAGRRAPDDVAILTIRRTDAGRRKDSGVA